MVKRQIPRAYIYASTTGANETRRTRRNRPCRMSFTAQFAWLFLLSLPVAAIAWTVTHEEIFREAREYCASRSRTCRRWYNRKLFYMLTCEYCFSHYVTLFFVAITRFKLLLEDWRGYLIAIFAVVWIANVYMSIFGRLRLEIKSQRVEIETQEKELEESPVK